MHQSFVVLELYQEISVLASALTNLIPCEVSSCLASVREEFSKPDITPALTELKQLKVI